MLDTHEIKLDPPVTVKDIPINARVSAWTVADDQLPFLSFALCFKKAGSAQDKKKGTANLLSHMLLEGCGDWDNQQFKEILLRKNIQLDICPNEDVFTIFIRCPVDALNDAVDILHKILKAPRFSDRDMLRIKSQLKGEMQQALHNHLVVAREKLTQFILPKGHPYIKDTNVCLKELDSITSADLQQFMANLLCQDTLQIAAAGNLDHGNFTQLLKKIVDELPAISQGVDIPEAELRHVGKTEHIKMDIPQTVMLFVQQGISSRDPDIYAASVINSILGGSAFQSRLFDEIREKRGLAYHVSSSLNQAQAMHLLKGIAMTKTEAVPEVTKLIHDIWTNIADGKITQEEFEFHQRYLISAFALSFSSTKDIVSVLVSRYQSGQDIAQLNERNKKYASLTLEDIKRVAKKMLASNNLTFVLVGR